MTTAGILFGLVGMGLTTVVVYHYGDIVFVAAGLAEKLQPYIYHSMLGTMRAVQDLRQCVTAVTLVTLEHVYRGLEQVPSEITVAIRYLGLIAWMDYLHSIAWMDHVHTTNATLQQVYALGTAALAGIKHTVSVLDSIIRATAPSEVAPYLTLAIILLVVWLVRLLLLAVVEIIWLLVYLIGVGLYGAGVLALLHTFYQGLTWLLVYTLQTVQSSANTLNAVLQFLAQSLTMNGENPPDGRFGFEEF